MHLVFLLSEIHFWNLIKNAHNSLVSRDYHKPTGSCFERSQLMGLLGGGYGSEACLETIGYRGRAFEGLNQGPGPSPFLCFLSQWDANSLCSVFPPPHWHCRPPLPKWSELSTCERERTFSPFCSSCQVFPSLWQNQYCLITRNCWGEMEPEQCGQKELLSQNK